MGPLIESVDMATREMGDHLIPRAAVEARRVAKEDRRAIAGPFGHEKANAVRRDVVFAWLRHTAQRPAIPMISREDDALHTSAMLHGTEIMGDARGLR